MIPPPSSLLPPLLSPLSSSLLSPLSSLLLFPSNFLQVPGILIGLGLSLLAFIPVAKGFESYTAFTVPLTLKTSSISLGVTVGFAMPLLALVGPVQQALSKTLRDALDLYHSLASDIVVCLFFLEIFGRGEWNFEGKF
jgi:hypothetical protein